MLGSLALPQGKKNLIFAAAFFGPNSATDLMFGVLICLHVDFCCTWILWLWLYNLIFFADVIFAAVGFFWLWLKVKNFHICVLDQMQNINFTFSQCS